jgi:hypothetical protein
VAGIFYKPPYKSRVHPTTYALSFLCQTSPITFSEHTPTYSNILQQPPTSASNIRLLISKTQHHKTPHHHVVSLPPSPPKSWCQTSSPATTHIFRPPASQLALLSHRAYPNPFSPKKQEDTQKNAPPMRYSNAKKYGVVRSCERVKKRQMANKVRTGQKSMNKKRRQPNKRPKRQELRVAKSRDKI